MLIGGAIELRVEIELVWLRANHVHPFAARPEKTVQFGTNKCRAIATARFSLKPHRRPMPPCRIECARSLGRWPRTMSSKDFARIQPCCPLRLTHAASKNVELPKKSRAPSANRNIEKSMTTITKCYVPKRDEKRRPSSRHDCSNSKVGAKQRCRAQIAHQFKFRVQLELGWHCLRRVNTLPAHPE